jgi:hypothetical protein
VFTYSTPTNTFGPSFNSNQFQSSATAAVSRDGSFVLTKLATSFALDTAPSFRYQRSLFKFGSAVAFDPQFDRLYATAPVTQQIVALDANTFVELFRVNVGEVPVIASFDTASISISPDSRYVAVPTSSGIRLVTLPSGAVPPPPSPAFGTPRDLVFDHAGERLYITTAEGLVWPYEIALRTLGTPYRIGGALNGVDIAPDDSFLIVAQEGHGVAQGTFQKLNLATGEITDIKYERGSGSLGSWDIAIASNGLAFATTGNAAFSGSTSPLRQIDLATNSITTRNVIPRGTVDNGTTIQRSADRSRVGFMEPSSTSGTVFTYSAATDSFGPP